MIGRLKSRRVGPIGLDIGTHCVKLIQFNGERNRVIDAVRWDLPASDSASAGDRWGQIASVVRQAREARSFRGREAAIAIGAPDLFVQNVPRSEIAAGRNG